jgi:dATP pyrophosphohydrolase
MAKIITSTVQVHVVSFKSKTNEPRFLVLQRSEKSKIYPLMWQVVTGKLKGKETAVETAIREFREETSAKPLKMWAIPYLTEFYDHRKDIIQISPVFGVVIDSKEKIKLSQEHVDYDWLSLKECIKRLPLPTHKEGTQKFWDYILSKKDKNMFLVNIDKKVKT